MLDTRNRSPYRELAEECRRLATSSPSSQVKNRYLLLAQDYGWLADLKEQAQAHGTPATVEENTAWAATMTGRFPAPWRIVEIAHGFAVEDASGQQLAVFYGLAEPNTTRQTEFLTLDEARQMAVDFAKLPKLIEQTWARSEVAGSPKGDKLAKLETNRSPQDAVETWRPGTRLPAVALPLAEMLTTAPKFALLEPDEWMSTPLLPRPSHPRSNRTKLLIALAVAALPAGYYYIVRSSDHPVDHAAVPQAHPVDHAAVPQAHPVDLAAIPQATTPLPPVEVLPLRDAQLPAAEAAGTNVGSPVEPEVPSLEQTAPLATNPTDSGIEAKPILPEKGSSGEGRDASTCFPSASAVRENRPGAWPSWTMRAPGHEGTRCWYAATRGSAHEHR
jgi:hypothetical protein